MKLSKKGKKIIASFLVFLTLIVVGGISSYEFVFKENKSPITTPENKPVDEGPKVENYHLSMTMIGDALYHGGTYKDGDNDLDGVYNFDHQLADIAPIVAKYDLAYYNQETILGGKELGLSSYPCFNSPQEVGDAFIKAGFNLVSLATNHTLDKGERGILKSVEYWRKQKNVMTAGSYDSEEDRNRSHIGEKNGITYAFLSYTYGTNGIPVPKGKDYLVNLFSEEQAKKDIEAVRDKVDVVMVAMHWGVEYTHVPTAVQRQQAQFLADLGVDIIIGSHPHVIEPIEYVDDTVVIYSLGNFISGQVGIERLVGMMASLEINKVVEDGKTTISIDNVKGDLLYTYHNGSYRNYRVIPFPNLTEKELPNHEAIYKKFKAIINKTNDPRISIGF